MARAKSATGPSGVPYKVYKCCPKLLRISWKILCVIWRRGTVADNGGKQMGSGYKDSKVATAGIMVQIGRK